MAKMPPELEPASAGMILVSSGSNEGVARVQALAVRIAAERADSPKCCRDGAHIPTFGDVFRAMVVVAARCTEQSVGALARPPNRPWHDGGDAIAASVGRALRSRG